MKRIMEKQCGSWQEFKDLVRGKQLARVAADSVNAGTKTITFAAGTTLVTDGVTQGCIVRDLTTGKAAKVATAAEESITLDEWINTLATQVLQVWTPPILPVDMVGISFEKGQPVLYFRQDDAIERETEVYRVEVEWLMNTGVGAAADRSAPFYVPPGKGKVTIELPFTHNADIEVHRYHGDWLSLAATDAVLLAGVDTDWEAWPAGKSLTLASNPVAEGSYAMDMLENAAGALVLTNPHAGWYRLDSTANGTDKTFNVAMEDVR